MSIKNDPIIEELFRKFGGSMTHYNPVTDAYSTNILRIHNGNSDDIMHDSGIFKPYFDFVKHLNIYSIDKCVSSTSFPKRCKTVDLASLRKLQKFDGDDCVISDYDDFISDEENANIVYSRITCPTLTIINCVNLDRVVNINSNGTAINLTFRDCDSLKLIHAYHDISALHIIKCDNINNFSDIQMTTVKYACIYGTSIKSFDNCNIIFDELDFHCVYNFDFRNIQSLVVKNVLTLQNIKSHTNILEILNSSIPIIKIPDSTPTADLLNKYVNGVNIPINKRQEYIMDCVLAFIDIGITDVI